VINAAGCGLGGAMRSDLKKLFCCKIGPEYWVGESKEQVVTEVCGLAELTVEEVEEELVEMDIEKFLKSEVFDEDLDNDNAVTIEKSLRHALLLKTPYPLLMASDEW